MKSIKELKDIYAGQDVYLLGSGASLNYIDPSFFDGKNVVCTNIVAEVYLPTAQVTVTKYHKLAEEIAQKFPEMKVVCSSGNQGGPGAGRLPEGYDNLYEFMHNPNRDNATDIRTTISKEDGWLLVAWSTITSAMHFCAYTGAKNIIVIGLDSGSLDGKQWVDGYYTEEEQTDQRKELNIKFEQQSIITKEVLKDLYGCNIYSLNPFINYNLEGHKYRGANSIN
jgi:hypothetical protein